MAALARGFIAIAVLVTALLVSGGAGEPALANHPITFPVDATLLHSNTQPAVPFGTFCIPSTYETPPQGWDPLYLRVEQGGTIDGQCHYEDPPPPGCPSCAPFYTQTGELTGFIGFSGVTAGAAEYVLQSSLSFVPHSDKTYTGTFNADGMYDAMNHRASGSGTYEWTCTGNGCPPDDTGNHTGTFDWELELSSMSDVDVSIDHIEVVQVVQDAGNTVPLVARKSTVARVFVKGSLALTGVGVILQPQGSGGATASGGVPQIISGGIGAVVAPVRENTDHSYNFLLPDEWTTEGSITLEAEAQLPEGITDPDESNNKGSVTVTFQERNGMDLRYLPICIQPGGTGTPTCPSQFVSSYHRFMEEIFPIADGAVLYRPLAIPQWNWPKAITSLEGDFEVAAALRKRFDLLEGEEGFRPDQLAGWLGRSMQNPTYGLSDPLWFAGPIGAGFGRISVQQDTRDLDALDPAFTLAHEIAHNLGRRHTNTADGCNAKDANTDWPYATSTIQEIGFDIDAKVVVPSSKKDVMTYCSPPFSNIWISPHTYKKLFDGNFQPASAGVAGAEAQYLIISGSARADGSDGTLNPAYTVTSAVPGDPPPTSGGTHCLRFGPFIVDYCFTLEFEDHRTDQALTENFFSLKVPLPPESTSVALIAGTTELARLDASASAPSVDVTTPSGFTGGNKTLSWSGSDSDGDDLLYTVLYSPDGGDSWLPIEVDTPASQFAFDVGSLDPSNQGMFRVLASDGLNTTADTTPPVKVGSIGVKGDVDCSGGRTSVDALIALQLASNLVDSAPCEDAGDVNCDAATNSLDALFILQDISGFDVALPPGCPPFE